VQEGDPKYLAPEILKSSNNITCAADIFSLGMSILELATDLDLPRGGDTWHQLRNGQIPTHLVSSLSTDLVEIIMKMIEPDHLKRANADQLLDMPRIRILMGKSPLKAHSPPAPPPSSTVTNKLSSFLACFFTSTLNAITYPFVALLKLIRMTLCGFGNNKQEPHRTTNHFVIHPTTTTITKDSLISNDLSSSSSSSKDDHDDDQDQDHNKGNDEENGLEKKQTSTPKKNENVNCIPLNLLNVNEDDYDDDSDDDDGDDDAKPHNDSVDEEIDFKIGKTGKQKDFPTNVKVKIKQKESSFC
jgi:serine/threonine protein kinase